MQIISKPCITRKGLLNFAPLFIRNDFKWLVRWRSLFFLIWKLWHRKYQKKLVGNGSSSWTVGYLRLFGYLKLLLKIFTGYRLHSLFWILTWSITENWAMFMLVFPKITGCSWVLSCGNRKFLFFNNLNLKNKLFTWLVITTLCEKSKLK